MSREEFIDAVRAQAWDDGEDCPTCEGRGKVYPRRFQVTHPAVPAVYEKHQQSPRPDGTWGCACGWEQDKPHAEHVADMVRAALASAAPAENRAQP